MTMAVELGLAVGAGGIEGGAGGGQDGTGRPAGGGERARGRRRGVGWGVVIVLAGRAPRMARGGCRAAGGEEAGSSAGGDRTRDFSKAAVLGGHRPGRVEGWGGRRLGGSQSDWEAVTGVGCSWRRALWKRWWWAMGGGGDLEMGRDQLGPRSEVRGVVGRGGLHVGLGTRASLGLVGRHELDGMVRWMLSMGRRADLSASRAEGGHGGGVVEHGGALVMMAWEGGRP